MASTTTATRAIALSKTDDDRSAFVRAAVWHGPLAEADAMLAANPSVAHHAAMTKLLLERGGDPNDVEVAYHSPEARDNAVLRLLVETGRLTPASMRVMLLRKIDWHDLDGVSYLLEHGADATLRGKPG